MTAKDLRKKFIEFFEKRGHKKWPASSLIPENDPSVLFTTAGMQQFKEYYSDPSRAQEKFGSKKIATIQPCIRTSDIDDVGDETHLTFFEMLGNFSFNDYFKKETVSFAIEFLTKELNLNLKDLDFFIFRGDEETKKDDESEKILKEQGILKIKEAGRNDNFWGPTGKQGPCGPTIDIYLNGVEIWSLVFNQYVKDDSGKYHQTDIPGVDTGMGLERLTAVLLGTSDVYQNQLFEPIFKTLEENIDGEVKYEDNKKAFRIIADHTRAAVFLLADGVVPGNIEQGYVLRRLIRRIIRYWRLLGGEGPILNELASSVIETYKNQYLLLSEKEDLIISELQKEEEKFGKTLTRGLKEFERILKPITDGWGGDLKKVDGKEIPGSVAFTLYERYGFPLELTEELTKEKGLTVDKEGFKKALKKHQEISRTSAKAQFKGGLSSESERTIKYHTATHLLLAALKQVLGDHIHQKGSNITKERLRFDFSHPEKLTDEQKQKVEDLVNQKISENLEVSCEEMDIEEAKKKGAEAQFISKYSDKVKVYSVGDFSLEVCGGPHVKNTGELGRFKITNEQSSSAGIRRIKAILE